MADLKLKYASSVDLTITLASLATSSTLTTGRQSAAVVNTTNLYIDYGIGGIITVGTSPTADTTIEVWGFAAYNDTPDYPDAFAGADAGRSVINEAIKQAEIHLIASMAVDTNTSNRTYSFAMRSLARVMGGFIPTRWGVWVTHNTGVNLNSTASNHKISITPLHGQSTA